MARTEDPRSRAERRHPTVAPEAIVAMSGIYLEVYHRANGELSVVPHVTGPINPRPDIVAAVLREQAESIEQQHKPSPQLVIPPPGTRLE